MFSVKVSYLLSETVDDLMLSIIHIFGGLLGTRSVVRMKKLWKLRGVVAGLARCKSQRIYFETNLRLVLR